MSDHSINYNKSRNSNNITTTPATPRHPVGKISRCSRIAAWECNGCVIIKRMFKPWLCTMAISTHKSHMTLESHVNLQKKKEVHSLTQTSMRNIVASQGVCCSPIQYILRPKQGFRCKGKSFLPPPTPPYFCYRKFFILNQRVKVGCFACNPPPPPKQKF